MLSLAVLALGAAFYLKQQNGNSVTTRAGFESVTKASTTAPSVVTSISQSFKPVPVSATPVVTSGLTPDQRQAAIDTEVERLHQLSMNDDPASLSSILADLTNPEKEIRNTAIEATKEFGSSNAIPALKATAMNTADTEEQIALLEAANFLAQPGISFGETGTPRTTQQIRKRNLEGSPQAMAHFKPDFAVQTAP